jgi:KaiC/GvpD/RAD55 family RecA-like ATPase
VKGSILISNTSLSRDRLEIVTLDRVEPRQVDWLWEGFLARGFLAMLSGDPAAGKTFLACRILADLSVGKIPGSELLTVPRKSLYISTEARPEYVLAPRLKAMGADLTRIGHGDRVLQGDVAVWGDSVGEAGGLQLAHLDPLRDALREHQAEIVVLDPLQSFFGEADSNSFTKVRPLMDNLARLAQSEEVCFLIIRHLTKSTQTRAALRGLGSVDFTASVMTEALVGTDPSSPERRIIAFAKNNLGKLSRSLAFKIDDGGFSWDGSSDLQPDQLLAPPDVEQQSQLDAAIDFLREELSGTPRGAKELQAEALSSHVINTRTLQRAAKQMNVTKTREGESGPWNWSI